METDIPTISVCVTTYQHVAYIRQCLESVLSQIFDGTLEVLVGDDGSIDGTRPLVDALALSDSRVRPFHHHSNLGPTGNLSFLVARARGHLIAHLDGDDFWLPGKLAAQLLVFNEDPRVVAVYCNANVVGATGEKLGIFNEGLPAQVGMQELLRRGNFLNHSSLVYRASARDAVLGIDKPFIDYRLHFRLLFHGNLAYVDKPLVGYRWRSAGSMVKTMPSAVYEGHLDAFLEAIAAGAQTSDVRVAIGRFWGKLMMQSIASGQWSCVRAWGRRITAEPAFEFSLTDLMAESILAFPRALASWWRRRHGSSVYFP
ncbi:MAG: glycosyltransferase [Rhodanobacter sp.]|nr:MAG: glycosyltransferase [Rhodanobacter sp.]